MALAAMVTVSVHLGCLLVKYDIVPLQPPVPQGTTPLFDSLTFGSRVYELPNHLGNIQVTVSDKKIGVDENNDGIVDYYVADVVSANDYYPFGQLQPGRQYGILGRYGFNGKENDNEVKGEGNQQDYGMRIYDPRLGRFLSVDPLSQSFPWYTPYQFAGNKPIAFIDLDGLEDRYYALELNYSSDGKLHGIYYREIEEMRAGKHKDGNVEWEIPVGHLGKGDATFVYVTYNESPQSVVTKHVLSLFKPRPKSFLEKVSDFFTSRKDDDIGGGFYLTDKEGGSLGDPFGPGAKKIDNIPDANALISMLGGGGGTDRGLIRSIPSAEEAEKIVLFLEALNESSEAGEKIGEIINKVFGKDKKESGDNNELQSIKNIGATNLNNTESKKTNTDTLALLKTKKGGVCPACTIEYKDSASYNRHARAFNKNAKEQDKQNK
ncbi:MAG TPA: RHS repeat-associated core domain-containing protein [Chitinophagaceae bacterium]|nr:RHS repeat-associated core domain-containing protein [Chitinophagaceae bacterium]